MTVLAMLFLFTSVSLVTGLTVFCYYRVLFSNKPGKSESEPDVRQHGP